MAQGIIRYAYWVDTRDMLADGCAKGGVGRAMLDGIAQSC